MEFGEQEDQKSGSQNASQQDQARIDNQEPGNAVPVDAEAPQNSQDYHEMTNELSNRAQNMARLFEGGVNVANQPLNAQLQDEMLRFRAALRDIVHKVESQASARTSNSASHQAVSELGAERDRKRAIYSQLIYIVLTEVDNEKLAKAWLTVSSILDKKEVMDIFVKMCESKEDFVNLIESSKLHEDSVRGLQQCVQQGDWVRLQKILSELIEQYDSQGYARRASILLEAGQQAVNQKDSSNQSQTGRSNFGLKFLSNVLMPSVTDLKSLAAQGKQKRLLREIKSATIEKLTNKIVKSFALEIGFITPFLMLIGLQYRQAALTDPTAQCYGTMANWLLTYFVAFGFFAVLRLLRVPVLRGLSHTVYFNYILTVFLIQVVFFSMWFFYGNAVFLNANNPEGICNATSSDAALAEQMTFNPNAMKAILGLLMLVHWFIAIALIQLVLFTLMLYSLWDGVVHATKKMQQGFSASSLFELFMEAAGEGELQDSVMIGGIQYLMNDDDFCCQRCKMPFDKFQMQANEFEVQLGEQTFATQFEGEAGEIVQLGCNHVFHRECIESFIFCPDCFAPIQGDAPQSFIDDGSEMKDDGEDSAEEGLLGHQMKTQERELSNPDQEHGQSQTSMT